MDSTRRRFYTTLQCQAVLERATKVLTRSQTQAPVSSLPEAHFEESVHFEDLTTFSVVPKRYNVVLCLRQKEKAMETLR